MSDIDPCRSCHSRRKHRIARTARGMLSEEIQPRVLHGQECWQPYSSCAALAKVYQLELVYSRCVVRFGKWGRRCQFALEAVARSDLHLLRVCPQKNPDTNEPLSMLHERSALCSLKWNCRHVCVQHNSSTQSASSFYEGQPIRRYSRAKIAIRAHGGPRDFACRSALQATLSIGCAQADLDSLLGLSSDSGIRRGPCAPDRSSERQFSHAFS